MGKKEKNSELFSAERGAGQLLRMKEGESKGGKFSGRE